MKKFERTLVMLLLCSIFCSLLAGCGSSTLELQDTKLHVKPGKTAQVSVETDSRPLTFESSDPDIATVDDNGVVEGVAEGPAIITVTNSKGKSETLQVIVDRVEPESITFDPAAFTLSPNEIVATDLIIHPDNTTYYKVSYSSSNNDVAMVDRKGLIKAVAAGKAVITATAENGISAQCAVTVRQNAESLDIEPTLKMQINDKETLKVTPVPANSVKENYTWNTSNPAVAIVDENTGVVTGVAKGTTTIVISKDGMLPARVTVNVTYAATTILVEAESAPDLVEYADDNTVAAKKSSGSSYVSGGYYVRSLPTGTTLTYTFAAANAGSFTMVMSGRNFNRNFTIDDLSTACEIKINDVAVNVAGKAWGYNTSANNDVNLGAVTLAASNTMTFKVIGDETPYSSFMLDCFTFTPVA